MSEEIVRQETVAIAPASLLQVIAAAVADPRCDVEKMRALFELQKDIQAEEHRIVFTSAMARLHAALPQITKYGKGKNNKFAKLEDIDVIIRPILKEFGFSFSFDEQSHDDKTVTFVAKLTHEDGHFETKRLTVPMDSAAKNRDGNAIRPAIQDAGSTVSYARRYLIKMHLNLIEADEDTDGEPVVFLTEDQAKDLEALGSEVKANWREFLKWMGVAKTTEIPVRDLRKAIEGLETKRRTQK